MIELKQSGMLLFLIVLFIVTVIVILITELKIRRKKRHNSRIINAPKFDNKPNQEMQRNQPDNIPAKKASTEKVESKPLSDSKKDEEKEINSSFDYLINATFFRLDQLRKLTLGDVYLEPIDAFYAFDQQTQNIISVFAESSPKIKMFLPNLNLSTQEEVAETFINLCMKTELGFQFGYTIKMKNAYLGLILINTPYYNKNAIKFPHWTIDFCLFSCCEKRGIMRASIIRILQFLKCELNVKHLYAYVDEHNFDCLKFMSNICFYKQERILIDPSTGSRAFVYLCDLTNIKFEF